MTLKEPSFTVGIEEEYLLIDPTTGDLAGDPPEAILKASEIFVISNEIPLIWLGLPSLFLSITTSLESIQ